MNRKKFIENLRQRKAKALERMEQLSAVAKSETRELNAVEKFEFDKLTADAAAIAADLEDLAGDPEPNPVPAANPKTEPTPIKDEKEILAVERDRVKGIRERVKLAKLPETLANELIDGGVSLSDASARIFDELAKTKPEDKANPNNPHPDVRVSGDQRDKLNAEMTAALLHRIDPGKHPVKDGLGRRFAGRTLLVMAEESLKAVGVRTEMLTPSQIVDGALMGRGGSTAYLESAGMHSTSDFPNILADVANKRMRQAYEAAPKTFAPFCRRVTAADFKPINVIQISDVSQFQQVNEHGEFKSATLSDSKESYSLKTYGEIVRVTRQTIINDDLRAFDKLTQAIGTAAARLENETVYNILIANAAMADTVALFHSSRGNALTGAGSALGLAGLAAGRTQMRLQKAPKGQILNLTPSYLVVPAALETTALQLTAPTNNFSPSPVTNDVPVWIRSLTPIVEPLLDAASSIVWFLFANPSNIDTIEYCYLEGQEGLYTEQKNGFEVDGVQIKGRLDFAAAAVEPRGMQRNAGA